MKLFTDETVDGIRLATHRLSLIVSSLNIFTRNIFVYWYYYKCDRSVNSRDKWKLWNLRLERREKLTHWPRMSVHSDTYSIFLDLWCSKIDENRTNLRFPWKSLWASFCSTMSCSWRYSIVEKRVAKTQTHTQRHRRQVDSVLLLLMNRNDTAEGSSSCAWSFALRCASR